VLHYPDLDQYVSHAEGRYGGSGTPVPSKCYFNVSIAKHGGLSQLSGVGTVAEITLILLVFKGSLKSLSFTTRRQSTISGLWYDTKSSPTPKFSVSVTLVLQKARLPVAEVAAY
jgi:hypothetical protein